MRFIKPMLLMALILITIFYSGCLAPSSQVNQVILYPNDGFQKTIDVEIAQNMAEWEKGLMYRTSMGNDSGMLFIFPNTQYRTFWMKNTLIPLDMLFISSDYQIVDLATMQPCKGDPCPDYKSKAPARYVLELNAGYSQRNNIAIGSNVTFHIQQKQT